MQPGMIRPRLRWSHRVTVPILDGQIVFGPKNDCLLLASSEKAKAEYRATLDVLAITDGTLEWRRTFTGQFQNALWSPLDSSIGAVGTVEVNGEYRGVACLWDYPRGNPSEPLRIGKERAFRCAGFGPDGTTLYIASHRAEHQSSIYSCDLRTRRVTLRVDGGSDTAFWSLAVSSDGKTLAAGSGTLRPSGQGWQTCGVRLYDVATGRLQGNLARPHGRGAAGIALSSDGRLVITGDGPEGVVRVYDTASGKPIHILRGHSRNVTAVAVSPHGKWIATASGDRTFRLWGVDTGSPLAVVSRHAGAVQAAAFSPDSRYLATGDSDGELHLWELVES